ncbi:Rtg3p KNAG_0C04330 [Huiozyma naganishii CBS 8797]|uniref:BHLH domain-containing protein n=1 Tax=Huiozyma naganishii (strain ATCC MYA-139 / BCRC 22969 / CBS 8797 / KCTC 17520 / NBRC 10181 / NCYC 3082 / Yp74L-3) TaxID=1071383 RepID=J7R3Y0_HUIN7|nr:hypothetical protein KNAG_0C04330 [Kazachstania naganishii CBS 8797]CCK69535.1 hypothetical protein KNAG_0C04330 [Kazachstania naganishii CBS 8797]
MNMHNNIEENHRLLDEFVHNNIHAFQPSNDSLNSNAGSSGGQFMAHMKLEDGAGQSGLLDVSPQNTASASLVDNETGMSRGSIYPSTPAQQHESMLYNNNTTTSNNNNNHAHNKSSTSNWDGRPPAMANSAPQIIEQPTSFLDDMFTASRLDSVQQYQTRQSQQLHGGDNQPTQIEDTFNTTANTTQHNSISEPWPSGSLDTHATTFNEPLPVDMLFSHGADDAMFNYTDDLSSSLSSSVHSDIMTPSSFSFNPQQLESLRSPSNSIRAGNYLSQSLRQPNFLNSPATPKSRHASLAVNGDKLSTSVPKSLTHLSTEEKLRRKRDFHNAVERRRRELIKTKIGELGNLVPPSLLCFDSTGKQVKPNKGIILNKTVEYISFLQQVLAAQEKRKIQLKYKLNQLEEKMGGLHIDAVGKQDANNGHEMKPVQSSETITSQNVSGERIIDTRYKPSVGDEFEDGPQGISDDLKQYLSGNIAEAEDNAKLMFGGFNMDNSHGDANAADYLLEFNS